MSPTVNARCCKEESAQRLLKENRKALFFLYQVVDEVIFERILNTKTTKEARDIVERSYRGADRVKRTRLRTFKEEFESLQINEGELIDDYVTPQ